MNEDDWPIFRDNNLTNLAGLTPAEQHDRGDLNGDGVNDFKDFRLFQADFLAANGPEAFAAVFDNLDVPEPAAISLAAISLLGLLAVRGPAATDATTVLRIDLPRWPAAISLLVATSTGLFVCQRAARCNDANPFHVDIHIDASETKGNLRAIWRFFGADEPNYATMKDGQRLLAELGELRPGEIYFRQHNLLTSGDGTPALKWGSTNVYSEDAAGRPKYDWTIVDGIFDGLLARGVRPYVEIGFMPHAMSTKPDPYRHEWRPGFDYGKIMTGWRYPPKDYAKWGELAYQWTKHCVDRYGPEEVRKWYWETWNEANAPYWGGTPDEFFKLHDFAVAGVRRALPEARVGGPDVAGDGGEFTRNFLQHCLNGANEATGRRGTPLDFISFHAKGAPVYVDGHVRMGISSQLKTIARGFEIVASFPELRQKPIVIGESDPEGCAACQGPSFGYRNGAMYSSYTAASFARKHDLADKYGVNLKGALTWAFEFEDQPYFAGFRQLATNGIALPVLNVFRMFSKLSGVRLETHSTAEVSLDEILASGVRNGPDVAAFASFDVDRRKLYVMIWHYHDDDVPGVDAQVSLHLANLPVELHEAKLTRYQIDQTHGNSYAEWQRMGSPRAPNEQEYDRLVQAAALAPVVEGSPLAVAQGVADTSFALPRQGVALLVVSWE